MGFNISGIAINKNYKQDFEKLKRQYDWNLEGPVEVSFETASSNYTENDICNVYFTENGTLIFISMERCIDAGLCVSDANSMTFVLSEMSMSFIVNYYEGKQLKRAIMETEGDRMDDSGDPLPVEAISPDTSEIIWNQMKVLLGKSFYDIDLGDKALQYRFAKNVAAPVVKEQTKVELKPKAERVPGLEAEKKNWWEFWK